MVQVAQYFAQRRAPSRSSRSPASYPVRSTQHLTAMAGFGAGLAGIGFAEMDRRTEILEQTEYSEGKTAWLQAQYDFDESLQADNDFGTYLERYNKTAESARKDILARTSLPASKLNLELMMSEQLPDLQAGVADKAWSKRMDFAKGAALLKIDDFVNRADPVAQKAAEEIYARGAGNIFSAEEAGRGIISVRSKVAAINKERAKQAEEDARQATVNSLASEAIRIGIDDGDVAAAKKFIRSSVTKENLTSAERNNIESQLDGALADKTRQENEYDRNGLKDFNRRIREGRDLSGVDEALNNYDFFDPKITEDLSKAARAKSRAIIEGTDVIDDIDVKRGFEDRARAIDSEDETVENFVAEMRSSGVLNEKTKDAIEDSARTTFTTSQKNAIARAVQEARDLELPILSPDKQVELEFLRGEKVTKVRQAEIIKEVNEQVALQGAHSAAAEEEIHAWVALEENRNKPRSVIDKETNYILTRYRAVRDAGLEAMRHEQRVREGKPTIADKPAVDALVKGGLSESEALRQVVENRGRKGPIRITGFATGPENIVSKTVKGKRVEGIKTKDGHEIFVGDEFIIAGKVWRYDGNGRATELRSAPVRR